MMAAVVGHQKSLSSNYNMTPISIDGTDITGATIDGTDVTEITVDGQTVFTSGPSNLPVAFSNLIAWYPFDSATYGGSNADDVTAILGGSGDDTAYDGTVTGATHQSSGGVTDINAGANSGAFDFNQGDSIDTGLTLSGSPFTVMAWFNMDTVPRFAPVVSSWFDADGWRLADKDQGFSFQVGDGSSFVEINGPQVTTNVFHHAAGVYDGSSIKLYYDRVDEGSNSISNKNADPFSTKIGENDASEDYDGIIEDVRIYNTALTQSQVFDIYDNTQP